MPDDCYVIIIKLLDRCRMRTNIPIPDILSITLDPFHRGCLLKTWCSLNKRFLRALTSVVRVNTVALTPREVCTLQERGAGLRRGFSTRCWRPAHHSIELCLTPGWFWKQSTQILHHMLSAHYRLCLVTVTQSLTSEDWRWTSSIWRTRRLTRTRTRTIISTVTR